MFCHPRVAARARSYQPLVVPNRKQSARPATDHDMELRCRASTRSTTSTMSGSSPTRGLLSASSCFRVGWPSLTSGLTWAEPGEDHQCAHQHDEWTDDRPN